MIREAYEGIELVQLNNGGFQFPEEFRRQYREKTSSSEIELISVYDLIHDIFGVISLPKSRM